MRSEGKLAIFILCVLAIGCSSLTVDKSTHDYPQASKDLFVSSCVESGGTTQACSCVLGKVEQKYTYGEMEDLETKIKAGQTPQDFTDFMKKAGQECAGGSSPAK